MAEAGAEEPGFRGWILDDVTKERVLFRVKPPLSLLLWKGTDVKTRWAPWARLFLRRKLCVDVFATVRLGFV